MGAGFGGSSGAFGQPGAFRAAPSGTGGFGGSTGGFGATTAPPQQAEPSVQAGQAAALVSLLEEYWSLRGSPSGTGGFGGSTGGFGATTGATTTAEPSVQAGQAAALVACWRWSTGAFEAALAALVASEDPQVASVRLLAPLQQAEPSVQAGQAAALVGPAGGGVLEPSGQEEASASLLAALVASADRQAASAALPLGQALAEAVGQLRCIPTSGFGSAAAKPGFSATAPGAFGSAPASTTGPSEAPPPLDLQAGSAQPPEAEPRRPALAARRLLVVAQALPVPSGPLGPSGPLAGSAAPLPQVGLAHPRGWLGAAPTLPCLGVRTTHGAGTGSQQPLSSALVVSGQPMYKGTGYASLASSQSGLDGFQRVSRLTERTQRHLDMRLSADQSGDYQLGNEQSGFKKDYPSYRHPLLGPAHMTAASSSGGLPPVAQAPHPEAAGGKWRRLRG